MKKQILSEEFRRMKKLAGIITESKTAEELFQMFKDEDLIDDRREYDVDDLMSAYPGLSKEEAEKLFQMIVRYSLSEGKLNENKDTISQLIMLLSNAIPLADDLMEDENVGEMYDFVELSQQLENFVNDLKNL